MIDEKKESYKIEFTEKELEIIYKVFDKLCNDSIGSWMSILQKNDQKTDQESFNQWILADMLDNIRFKAGSPIGKGIRNL